jgi:hypothetical protein
MPMKIARPLPMNNPLFFRRVAIRSSSADVLA